MNLHIPPPLASRLSKPVTRKKSPSHSPTFIPFVTFCSNALRSLLFHLFPNACRHWARFPANQTPSHIPYLCSLCYLLFKCSSLPFVSPVPYPRAATGPVFFRKPNPLSNSVPLLPLLPSVQMLFAPFCFTCSLPACRHWARFPANQTPSQIPYLCSLCYLLFKCSSLPFVSPVPYPRAATGPVFFRKPNPLSHSVPLFPLLPSVQMLFAPFCFARSHR
jgi:hypothetical protein